MSDSGSNSREVLALRNLHDVITAVHSGQDLEDVLQTAAQGVVDVLGFEVAVIDCVDDHGYVEALAVAGDEDACLTMKSRRIPLTEILSEFDIADEWGRLRFVPHDRLEPDATASWVPDLVPLDAPDAWHPLDALYAPLHGPNGDLLGVISVDVPIDRRRPSVLGRQVLEMYAVQAGLAIHHAQERARLNERVRLAAAVRAVVETATHELDLAAVMAGSFQPLAAGFRCERVVLQVWPDPGEDRLDASVTALTAVHPPPAEGDLTPWPEHEDEALAMLGITDWVAVRCWDKGRTAVLDPLEEPGEDLVSADDLAAMRRFMDVAGVKSAMLVPLGSGPQCLGHVLLLREEHDTAWTEAEGDAALEVGREMGRAVHRAHLYARERELVAELQELDRTKGEMINTITHELKNPLTSIRGYVELLAESDVAPREVAAIERNVRRLVTLIDDLLMLAKVSDPNRDFVPAQVDLAAVLDEVCDAAGRPGPAQGRAARPRWGRGPGRLGRARRADAAGAQHREQRREVHAPRRLGDPDRARRRRPGGVRVHRHRSRHQPPGQGPALRGVRPLLQPGGTRGARLRPGPGDRAPHRRAARRRARRHLRGRRRQHLHGAPPLLLTPADVIPRGRQGNPSV